MRTDAKDLPPDSGRSPGRRDGACFMRGEAVARSLALSCAAVLHQWRWLPTAR